MFDERCVSAASLVTPNGIFYFYVYESNGPVAPVYHWECRTDFNTYCIQSGIFHTYHSAWLRADRERCFFATAWDTSEGMPWTSMVDEVAV